jgi:futalosine hydrolase
MKWVSENGKPDLAINAGIAGSFSIRHGIGDVVMPMEDCFADSGIEDAEVHRTIFESNLASPDEFPFNNGVIAADRVYTERLNGLLVPVKAITCNTATGSVSTRDRLIGKFNPDIETMEGASFFYICTLERIPFFAVRAVSNFIETRNRDNWNIPLALERLTGKLEEIFNNLILKDEA